MRTLLGISLCAAIGVTLICTLPAHPQPQPQIDDRINTAADLPTAARRLVRFFDFEEPNNPDKVPMDWVVAQEDPRPGPDGSPLRVRPGFPTYNTPRFDAPEPGGTRSVILPTRGGSTALRLRTGVINVLPGADYAVTARVRTDKLTRAGASMSLSFLDQRGRRIPGHGSFAPITQTQGTWTPIEARLLGAPDNATFLRIELLVLQPEHQPGAQDSRFKVWSQDRDGSAWFDDVAVFQIPRVEIDTGSPVNIITGRSPPTLRVIVKDLTAEPLRVTASVRDLDGNTLVTDSLTPGRASSVPWNPSLPRHGWYLASIDVFSGDLRIGRRVESFLWLPAPAFQSTDSGETFRDRSAFGVVQKQQTPEQIALLPDLASSLGTGFVILPGWDDTLTAENAPSRLDRKRETYERLLEAHQSLTLEFRRVPEDLRDAVPDAEDVLGLASLNPDAWLPHILPTIDAFGQRISKYQLGSTSSAPGFPATDPADAIGPFRDAVGRLVPAPEVALPWRADHELPDLSANSAPLDSVTLAYPSWFSHERLPEIIDRFDDWRTAQPGSPSLTMVLESAPERMSARDRVIETARRAVEFWARRSPLDTPDRRIAIEQCWTSAQGPRPRLLPGPELAVWRTLSEHLARREVITRLPTAPGVVCYILARRIPGTDEFTDGALVYWNTSAPQDDAWIAYPFGKGPFSRVDIFGNEQPIFPTGNDQTVVLRAGDTPAFLEGIDPYFARFIAGVRIEPRFIPSIARKHDLFLIIDNPWSVRMSGKVEVRHDENTGLGAQLAIAPKGAFDVSASAGQTIRVPITVSPGPAQESGPNNIEVLVRVRAGDQFPVVRIPQRLSIGLDDLELIPDVQLMPTITGPDVVVTATVINRSRITRTLRVNVAAPGMPTQQLNISNLARGQQETKQFIFRNAAEQLSGKRAKISIQDVDQPHRLNKSVRVP